MQILFYGHILFFNHRFLIHNSDFLLVKMKKCYTHILDVASLSLHSIFNFNHIKACVARESEEMKPQAISRYCLRLKYIREL